ncbi:hypothetical protein [Brevibacterium album]|uniref:hypothetical protein n=1 Tax=Brevibacterium album TaxID=417948 RepID=UPI00048DB182|nr:hypothetical protein [Brevibacterium album]
MRSLKVTRARNIRTYEDFKVWGYDEQIAAFLAAVDEDDQETASRLFDAMEDTDMLEWHNSDSDDPAVCFYRFEEY